MLEESDPEPMPTSVRIGRKTSLAKSCNDFLNAIDMTEIIFGRSLFAKTFLVLVLLVLVTFLEFALLFQPQAFGDWKFFFLLICYKLHGLAGCCVCLDNVISVVYKYILFCRCANTCTKSQHCATFRVYNIKDNQEA